MKNREILNEITTPLLYWYADAARDLPWRREPTPYHVWISEIMLQQTRVEAVKGYYTRFLAAFPDAAALAAADEDQLNKVWQGLGYYSRARNLKRAAIEVCERFGGELPGDHAALLTLPGVGAYTAGAIASIAFGLPIPAVDGNVLRVITRLTASPDDITKQTTKDEVAAALAGIYPRTPDEASAMTQALMELGATVCIPNGVPHCGECPLRTLCMAHAAGEELRYPNKAPKRARVREDRTVFLIRCSEKYAIRKRPDRGLLAGLWEFPSADGIMDAEETTVWAAAHGIRLHGLTPLPDAKHIFTHIEWHMKGFLADADACGGDFVWADKAEIAGVYSVPSAFKAYLKLIASQDI